MAGYHFAVEDSVACITFDMPGKLNVMNDAFIGDMEVVLARLEAERSKLAGVVLTSAKSTFFAGGDLALMGRAKSMEKAALCKHFERLKAPFRRLEKLGI